MSKDPLVAERFSTAVANKMTKTPGYIPSPKHRWGYYKTSKSKENKIFYRSSYELAFLQTIDARLNVTSIVGEPFSIEYKFENKRKRYIPDFLYTTRNCLKYLVEVKPKSLLNKPINLAKFKAAKEYCQENNLIFQIWDEDKLSKEILKLANVSHTAFKKVILSCKFCNNIIGYSPSRPKKYCSKHCYVSQKRKEAGMLEKRSCIKCNKNFSAKYSCQKYCSTFCRNTKNKKTV